MAAARCIPLNATLKRQLYLSQMEIDVLKKLQELERGNR